ncbi:MAG: DUF4468 domain-containing protein [Bacteroidales bacterium]|nr:DUF4468 domain-containing protein [Bacteroidales bacterium]MCF6341554.1 DUF4468 domain-containing protein [Bacteroidales bacterium]
MKELFILVFFFAGFNLFAQETEPVVPVDSETGNILFREVIDEQGTQNQLFNRCIYWLNDFYANPTRVTTIRDVNTGKVEGRHNIRLYYYNEDSVKMTAGTVDYVFVIEMKPGKYRYTISDLKLRAATRMPVERWLNKDDPAYDPRWEDYLRQIAGFFNGWSESLKAKMKPEVKKKEDDW